MAKLELRKFRDGDAETIAAVHRLILKYVHRHLYAKPRVRSVVSDAWVELLAKLDAGAQPENFVGWILGCANNAIRRELTRLRRKTVTYESWLHGARDPEDRLPQVRQELAQIDGVLEACSDRARQAFEGSLLGLTDHELAEELGISPGAVRMSIHRTRQKIRHQRSAAEQLQALRKLARLGGHDRPLRLPWSDDG